MLVSMVTDNTIIYYDLNTGKYIRLQY